MFKTIGSTERPDSVAAKLLEGRLAIICSGTPFVLTIPFLFIEYFQSSEDYYATYAFGTINRLIRILAFISTVSIPAVYLAVLNYHQEMIPTNLAISISVARQGVPFPTFFEIILFLFIFEILREASTRIPGTIGQTVGIVGALVIGQAAVMARLISAPLVILVSFTGITGLLNIDLKGAAVIMRLILILSAMVLGLYGYIFALCGLAFYLISLRSFGVPYMLDSYLINGEDIKDTVIRVPWSFMKTRPQIIGKMRPVRQHTLKKRKK
jgi:spore germination protein KA